MYERYNPTTNFQGCAIIRFWICMRWVLEIFFSFFSSLEVFGKYSFIFSMKVTSPRNLPFLGGKDLKGMLYFSNRSAIKFVIQKTWRRKVQKKALFFIPLHYYNFYWECGCTNKSGHGRALVEGGLWHSLSPQKRKKRKEKFQGPVLEEHQLLDRF